MRFDSLEELVRYVINENVNLKYTDVDFKLNAADKSKKIVDTKENFDVIINTFSNSPIMEASVGSENVLYVDSYEAIKNACGVGKITVFGKTLITNICEMDNQAHINLSLDFKEQRNYNIDFILKPLSEKPDNSPSIQIKDVLLNESKAG